jgi:hypothetical protein
MKIALSCCTGATQGEKVHGEMDTPVDKLPAGGAPAPSPMKAFRSGPHVLGSIYLTNFAAVEYKVLPWHEHIPLHRLWVIVRVGHIPASMEVEHLLECEDCLRGLSVCLNAKSFGAALRVFDSEDNPETKAG